MNPGNFYKLKEQHKLEIFTSTSEKKGLSPFAIEKDWWTVQTLKLIFELESAPNLIFKGGTALSKAWNLIRRFSEDIDLGLNREYLGFEAGLISKSQIKKLRRRSCEYISNVFFKQLKFAFNEKGYYNLSFEIQEFNGNDQDPISILISYPAITHHSPYILPRVKLNLGVDR